MSMNPTLQAWVGRARGVPIERELERRGIRLRGNGRERTGACPKCGGHDRFSINTSKRVFNCRGCATGGDVIKLVQHLDGCDFMAACTTLAGEPPPKANGKDRNAEPKKIVVAEYPYEDASGALVFVSERLEYQNPDGSFVTAKDGKRKKSFRQKRPDPDRPGLYLFNVDGVPTLPYRAQEVIEAVANEEIIAILEGERKVDLLRSLNFPSTCNAAGAGKWRSEHSEYLRGADVVLIPDNDDAGRKHMDEVGAALTGVAKRVRVLVLPNLPPKGDIVDWEAAGGTREALEELIVNAPDWQPLISVAEGTATNGTEKTEAGPREQELLDALARLPRGIEFARQRKKVARELGVSQVMIDAELEARRGEKATPPLHDHWVVEPWPEKARNSPGQSGAAAKG
jgi:DNA primase